jgi:hypothetical protein
VRRMKLVRQMFAVFISAGLVLAPVQTAIAMRMIPMASTVGTIDATTPPANPDCSCCTIAVRCPMMVCATHCVQIAPTSDAAFRLAVAGYGALRGFAPSLHDGLNWQPPTPPPRV